MRLLLQEQRKKKQRNINYHAKKFKPCLYLRQGFLFKLMSFKNYYILLGVNYKASFEEIKIAYRELAKKHHPDKNQGNIAAEESFKEIQQAYTILSNQDKRKKYDLHFSYVNSYKEQSLRPAQAGHTPYTGNAYQYAQQQAQQKQQEYNTVKKESPSPDKSESYYLLISICIALILLCFIISYSK